MTLCPEDQALIAWSVGLDNPPSAPVGEFDWTRFARRAGQNRLAPLLYTLLRDDATRQRLRVPEAALDALKRAFSASLARWTAVEPELPALRSAFAAAGVPVLLLRGAGLAVRAYGDPVLRPARDIDLLVRRADLTAARRALETAGYARPRSPLPAAYFEKYHLHLTYVLPPGGPRVELHWALDHRFTPFTIAYDDVFRAAIGMDIGAARWDVPCPEHDVLCNAVHLVKHACFLPFNVDAPDLPTGVVDAAVLGQCADIARALQAAGAGLDWATILQQGKRWGTGRELDATLRTLESLWPGAVPADVLARTPRPRPGTLERAIFRAARGSSSHGRLQRIDPRSLARPARALDILRYMAPGATFIRRRYGCRTTGSLFARRALHPLVAGTELAGNLAALCRHLLRARLTRRRESRSAGRTASDRDRSTS